MTSSRSVAVSVIFLLSVLSAPATASPLGGPEAPALPDGEGCFPGDGHRFDIGTGDPGMVVVVHSSVLPDVVGSNVTTTEEFNDSVEAAVENGTRTPLQPVSDGAVGALGMEAYGVALGQEVVSMRVGVLFDGIDDPWAFLQSPVDAFSVVFHYRFDLPAIFGPAVDPYELDEAPITGVKTADCAG